MTRTAAITGVASGIGQAACRRLPEAGWTVFGLDNARERLDRVSLGFAGFQGRFGPVLRDVARYVTGTTIPVNGGTQAGFIPRGSNP
jgi:NADP-dependent 3-hydroxy acid dehydrogenase YdfG